MLTHVITHNAATRRRSGLPGHQDYKQHGPSFRFNQRRQPRSTSYRNTLHFQSRAWRRRNVSDPAGLYWERQFDGADGRKGVHCRVQFPAGFDSDFALQGERTDQLGSTYYFSMEIQIRWADMKGKMFSESVFHSKYGFGADGVMRVCEPLIRERNLCITGKKFGHPT